MADAFANKIKRLELENFTCFGKVEMDFSPGINVFIGENGTGKTHLLKVLYTGVSSLEEMTQRHGGQQISGVVGNKLIVSLFENFKVAERDTLIRDQNAALKVLIEVGSLRSELNGSWSLEGVLPNETLQTTFVPLLEMLSWSKGFISAYENRESYIDETYYRLAKSLNPLPLKGKALEIQEPLFKDLEEAIRAKVIRRGDDFFISFLDEQREYPAPVIATGVNKLAQLIYLIMNGSLNPKSILFWDEPEANLNPKYIVVVAKFLQTLASAGCQIFVATHDYLLPYELSLSVEYKDIEVQPVPDMKFFALYKGENGTEIEEGATMPDLNHDAIMEGHSMHHNREDILFRKSVNPPI